MQFRSPGRSTEARTVVDAWLEDRNVQHGTSIHTPFANGASIRRLPQVDEVESGESSEPNPRGPQSDQFNPSITNNQTNSESYLKEWKDDDDVDI